MDGKVKIVSQVPGHVGVYFPNLNFRREFSVKGQVISFPQEIMEEAMFDEGFKNMLDQGILCIQELDDLKALGLEEEESTEPKNYPVFKDSDYIALIQKATIEEFNDALDSMRDEQKRCLIDWATELKLRDPAKLDAMKDRFKVDVEERIYVQKKRGDDE